MRKKFEVFQYCPAQNVTFVYDTTIPMDTYHKKYLGLLSEYDKLVIKYNTLFVEKVNILNLCGTLTRERDDYLNRIWELEKKLANTHSQSGSLRVPPKFLKFLKQRCHPDRCNDKVLATEVMKWLNSQSQNC